MAPWLKSATLLGQVSGCYLPYTINEHWLLAHGKMTSRSSSDSCQATERLRHVVLCGTRIQLTRSKVNLGSNGTNPASICINDTASNCNTSWQAKLVASLLTQSAAKLSGTEIFSVLSDCQHKSLPQN